MKKLQETITSVRKGTFPYKQKTPKLNFSNYNDAQINETVDFLEAMRDIVDLAYQRIQQKTTTVTEPQKGPGRPSISIKDVVKVQLMEAYFGTSDRVSQGFLRMFKEKLAIAHDFSYKTLERSYDPERSRELLDEIFKMTNEIGNSKEKEFSIDGTGDPCTIKVNYENKRVQQRQQQASPNKEASDAFPRTERKHDFVYSVFSIGVNTKIIGGYVVSDDHSRGELSFFQEVILQTMGICPCFDTLFGDGIYANRVACAALKDTGVRPYFCPSRMLLFVARV